MNKPSQVEIRSNTEDFVDPRIDLAVERTELALERTFLAWVRTVLSLMGGGFAIDKGMKAFFDVRIATGKALINNGHAAGMVLTISGTVLMVLVTMHYVKRSAQLAKMKGGRKSIGSPDLILSLLIISIGTFLIYLMWGT